MLSDMAIKVRCPTCGAKRSLADEFRGLSVKCPKCGNRFMAAGAGTDSTEVPFLPSPESASSQQIKQPNPPPSPVEPPTRVARGQGDSPSSSSFLSRAEAERERRKASEKSSFPPLQSEQSTAAKPSSKEYKVLTRKNLWFSREFNPEGLEEALNTFAKQGWILKSTSVLKVADREGEREELIVVLER